MTTAAPAPASAGPFSPNFETFSSLFAEEQDETGARLLGDNLYAYQSQECARRQSALLERLKEYKQLSVTLDQMIQRSRYDLLAPVAGGLGYFSCQLQQTNMLRVLIGDGWFVERSVPQAKEIVGRRLEFIKKELEQCTEEERQLEERKKLLLATAAEKEEEATGGGGGKWPALKLMYGSERGIGKTNSGSSSNTSPNTNHNNQLTIPSTATSTDSVPSSSSSTVMPSDGNAKEQGEEEQEKRRGGGVGASEMRHADDGRGIPDVKESRPPGMTAAGGDGGLSSSINEMSPGGPAAAATAAAGTGEVRMTASTSTEESITIPKFQNLTLEDIRLLSSLTGKSVTELCTINDEDELTEEELMMLEARLYAAAAGNELVAKGRMEGQHGFSEALPSSSSLSSSSVSAEALLDDDAYMEKFLLDAVMKKKEKRLQEELMRRMMEQEIAVGHVSSSSSSSCVQKAKQKKEQEEEAVEEQQPQHHKTSPPTGVSTMAASSTRTAPTATPFHGVESEGKGKKKVSFATPTTSPFSVTTGAAAQIASIPPRTSPLYRTPGSIGFHHSPPPESDVPTSTTTTTTLSSSSMPLPTSSFTFRRTTIPVGDIVEITSDGGGAALSTGHKDPLGRLAHGEGGKGERGEKIVQPLTSKNGSGDAGGGVKERDRPVKRRSLFMREMTEKEE